MFPAQSPSDWWHLSPVDLFILGLATWRLTSLLVQEDGPWNILARLRHAVGVRYDEHSVPFGTNTLAELFTCMWCGSVWVAGLMVLSFWITPSLTRLIGSLLSLSAIAIAVDKVVPHE